VEPLDWPTSKPAIMEQKSAKPLKENETSSNESVDHIVANSSDVKARALPEYRGLGLACKSSA
jgi:hypothetical protein